MKDCRGSSVCLRGKGSCRSGKCPQQLVCPVLWLTCRSQRGIQGICSAMSSSTALGLCSALASGHLSVTIEVGTSTSWFCVTLFMKTSTEISAALGWIWMLSRAVCALAELLCFTQWVFPLCTQVFSLVTQEPQALEAKALPGPLPSLPHVPPAALGLASLLDPSIQKSLMTGKAQQAASPCLSVLGLGGGRVAGELAPILLGVPQDLPSCGQQLGILSGHRPRVSALNCSLPPPALPCLRVQPHRVWD